MPEQKGKDLLIPIYFGKNGVPVTSLADITVVVFEFNASGSAQIDTGAASEIGGGFYGYVVDSSKIDANAQYPYSATTAAGDVDEATVVGVQRVGQIWVEHLDADISSLLGAIAASRPSGTTERLYALKNNTLFQAVTELGDLVGWEEIYFTMKTDASLEDSEATIQVSKDDGLQIINGEEAATSANGSITIDDTSLGNLTIFVDEVEMAKIETRTNYVYDIKLIRGGVQKVITLADGIYTITESATKEIT